MKASPQQSEGPTIGDLLRQLPKPVVEIVRTSQEVMASELMVKWSPFLSKLVEYTFVYLMCYFGFGYGWILFCTSVLYYSKWDSQSAAGQGVLAAACGSRSESEVLKESLLQYYPSWVVFSDYDRVEWINEIMKQLWSHIDPYSTFFVQTFIEPKIKEILDRMNLQQASRFHIKRVMLGSVPARVGGIKVYERQKVNREEIVLDCDISYSGDARLQFTLQGMAAEINHITFRGLARITLKPLLNTFPFVGGMEMYFLNMPSVDYSLGGIGTFGDLPGISMIVKNVVMSQIRSRFVWPNRIHMYLPLEDIVNPSSKDDSPVAEEPDKTFMMRRPTGILTVHLTGARDLVKKDKHMLGSGKSDPYAIIAIGERRFNFRDKYVAKSVNPTWDYRATFMMEDWTGQNLMVEVYDHDKADADDFMGRATIELKLLISGKHQHADHWITLSDVKHGDIHMQYDWTEAQNSTSDDPLADKYIVSLLVDSCHNLSSASGDEVSTMYPRVKVYLNKGAGLNEQTCIQNKTSNPLFEESFLLESNSPSTDVINLEVVDTKKSSTSLGNVSIRMEDIIHSPSREIINVSFKLENGLHKEAAVVISAKLYSTTKK
jgi:Ca2+-dependent lipid-binding protein